MSTAATPSQYPALDSHNFAPNFDLPASPFARRASYTQGRGLEILGHAIEYLADSRMFMVNEPAARADAEATQILMLRSRQIFSECVEVVPPSARLKLWIAEHFTTPADC